ncbi:hypothetical protein AYO20_11649 [Fonsecaea nubica]|uniref:Uncharacterized protein n=1 Tax=Fonsecaea nubica TaxID=856822 RepID=A0A178BQ90_9EURO|nr:hypothetical protein AYO20_11649 [Fonsecaea nubica]OAL19394.1 hypothetical protein AYO20_11649 [Fonsecaea nubica]
MAVVDKGLKDEISRLIRLLKERDNDIQEQETTMEELRAAIKISDSQTVVAVEEVRLPIDEVATEVKEHPKIDEWYVEESTPADELARLGQELQDAQDEVRQLNKTVEQLRKQRDRVVELERLQRRANLKLIGRSLVVIEALVRDGTLLVQHVLETVAGRLDAIDSAPSANRPFDEIDGYLENVTGHLKGCIQQAMLDAAALNGVVRNMRLLLPGLADKNDLNNVSRLYGEVQMFKTAVEGLLAPIKEELVGAGGGGAPDQLVFPSSLKSERKKMTSAMNMVSQLIVAMAGFCRRIGARRQATQEEGGGGRDDDDWAGHVQSEVWIEELVASLDKQEASLTEQIGKMYAQLETVRQQRNSLHLVQAAAQEFGVIGAVRS